jgi:AAA15 family ATPase/GTPase
MLPLVLMGQGLGRFASILLRIANARNGVVMVDEIENGFHYSVMEKVWRAIGEAARRFDVQVFATTHSWECIGAAHRAFEAAKTYDFRLHRLDRVDGDIEAVVYDQKMLSTAMATDLEVR